MYANIYKLTKKCVTQVVQLERSFIIIVVYIVWIHSAESLREIHKGTKKTDAESHATYHLLFIDDLNLLEVKKFMNNIRLEINKENRGIPTSKSFEELDNAVRAVLVKNKIHLLPGCKERLQSVEFKNDHMFLQLLDSVTKKKLEEAQHANLYNEIKNRKLHSKLFSDINNELVSVSGSSRWLKKGNIKPRDEADRNVFWGAEGMSQHCKQSKKTVEHLATRLVRCIHLLLLNKYKFKSSKRIRSHSVQEILNKKFAEI
ncbi:hypothetical protein CWI38_0727p0010 [Hamiltosporidium tvaerminnensis]|uniref:Uncharacterized protein n=1 Tax=Hamiltosporidium tvaerminnensis TaxID=1176355 RepID=A0A4Q9LXS3_9MICR|nr:hypothetical protein CWI38_0727p0010 [Hamiltosporidium tvaerminnensis]